MPRSSHENKHIIKEWYERIEPGIIVDVGPGEGTYAKLLNHPREQMNAIEAWAPYVNEFDLNKYYNEIAIADVRYVVPSLFQVDLVILGDVIEHLPKKDAQKVLFNIKDQARWMIVAVPIVHMEQGAYEGNWFETHHHHWTYEEMADELSPGIVDAVKGEEIGYFLWGNNDLRL